jgi:hypothetical protein
MIVMRSTVYFGVNSCEEMKLELGYPISIPDNAIISRISFLEGFCGHFEGFFMMAQPVDVSLFKLVHLKFPGFLQKMGSLKEFQTTFQTDLKWFFFLGTPMCFDETNSVLGCPITKMSAIIQRPMLVSLGHRRIGIERACLDILILAGLKSNNDMDSNTEPRSLEPLKKNTFATVLVEYIKTVIFLLEENEQLEEAFMEFQYIQKLRGCIEGMSSSIDEYQMNHLIKFIRVFKQPSLIGQAFNDLILNPLIIRKMDQDAKCLMQDFIIADLKKLSMIPPFNKYLAKRMILIEVIYG